ncbi:hypothetical protein HGB07_09285 [Candidatus Roizmanbacteria bacterium]|nr:hypothetical protein [Candidatus Roizmanbacteria bacterium]
MIILSFAITKFGVSDLFVNNTPVIRPNLDKYIVYRIKSLPQTVKTYVALLTQPKIKDKLKDIPFSKLAVGVYAKEDGKASFVEYRAQEMDWIVISYLINGKTIKIKVPKGQKPPPLEIVESMQTQKTMKGE